jgi:outer membrane protein, heavy metal efflux system
MRNRPWVRPGVLAVWLWTGLAGLSPAFAQITSTSTATSLRQGFEAAWARQPEQRSAALRRDAQAAQLAAAHRWTPEPPSLELAARTDRLTRNEGAREYDANLAIPLWLPGEQARTRSSASAEAAALDARLLAAQWRVAAEVRDAYWTLHRATVEKELAERRWANATRLAEDVARRVRAGDLARADSHQADGTVAAAQAALAEAEVAHLQAASAWKSLTGQAPAAGAPPARSEPRPTRTEADADHPALRELGAKAEVARAQRDLAAVQNRAHTELTVGAVRERDGFGARYAQSIVVGLRIPLGTSRASKTRIATAAAEQLEAQVQWEVESARVRDHVVAASATLQSLERARDAAERRAALARAFNGFLDKSFRLGETDLPNLLRAELEAFEADRQAARSRLDVDAAISKLRQALGLLPE